MSKEIQVTTINGFNGKAVKTVVRDEDGEVKWEIEPDKENDIVGKPKMKDADTVDLIKVALLNIPREIQKGNDALRVSQMWNKVDAADGAIVLHDKTYEWFHRLLNRTIPLTAEQKKIDNIEALPYSQHLWGLGGPVIVNQLKIEEEQEDLLTIEEE